MKRSFLLGALAAASILSSASAEAAGRWPNWYLGLHGALDYVSDSSTDDNPVTNSFSSDTGFGYGVSVGYRPATEDKVLRNMRFEAEWLQQQNDIADIDSTVGTFTGDGTTKVSAFMGNIYYDFVTNDQFGQPRSWTPYLGGGLGIAKLVIDDASLSLGNVTNTDSLLAWQLLAGVSYTPTFMPFTEWSLGYRYFNTTSASLGYIGGGTFSVDYSSHNAEVGVKLLF